MDKINEQITTYNDLIKLIKKYNLQDKKIILGVEGYNTQKYNENIYLKNINGNYILCDSCGLYYEEMEKKQ